MKPRLFAIALAAFVAGQIGPTRSQPAPPQAPAGPPAAAGAPLPVWHVPASTEMPITGEYGHLEWPIYVPADIVPSVRSFQVAFQAAIAVMPEASSITLAINGQMVGRVPIASPKGMKTATIDVPPGLLVSGWNAVGLEISQRHRVDCTMASTYELSTQIDPMRTGFIGVQPRITALTDLPALATEGDGSTRLHLLLPKSLSPIDLGRAVRVVEQIAIRAHYLHPVVDTEAAPTGLNVAVGNPDFLASLPVAAKTTRPVQLAAAADGGLWLSVRDGDADSAAEAFGTGEQPGSDEGLKVLARHAGLRLRPGGGLSLADYAEARLEIDGGYSAGLTPDARMVVRVNGVIDGSLDLDRSGGAVLQGQIIHMPLDPFRPGHNHVEIEVQLPNHADETCDTLNSIGAKERFLLLGTSTISMPPLARVAQFPSISATLAGNLRVTPDAPPKLFVPRITDASIAAIGTLLANASVTTGVPTGAVIQRGTPSSDRSPAVVIGEASDVPASAIAAAGVDPQVVSLVWRSGARPAPGAGDTPRTAAPVSDPARLDAWGDRVEDSSGWLGGPGSMLGSLGDRFAQSLRSAGIVQNTEQPLTITGDTSFIFAQGLNDGAPLTLITARDGAALAAGVIALTRPSLMADLSGRAVTLEDGAAGASLVPVRETVYFRTQSFSLSNDRLVAAGWVSKHAAWYIGAVLLAATFLGISTWACLSFGRRTKPA